MARYMLFYRREGDSEVWQYGRFRPADVRGMRKDGWRRIRWMEESK